MELETGLGYLGANGLLYCSQGCAAAVGVNEGRSVDEEELEALVEIGAAAAATVCPGCGTEFAVDWPLRTGDGD
jgi:hypothetical protein